MTKFKSIRISIIFALALAFMQSAYPQTGRVSRAEEGKLISNAIRIQHILGSQLRRMEVVQMLPAETSARLTMVERLQAILGSNLSVGRHSARSERLICEPCGV